MRISATEEAISSAAFAIAMILTLVATASVIPTLPVLVITKLPVDLTIRQTFSVTTAVLVFAAFASVIPDPTLMRYLNFYILQYIFLITLNDLFLKI